jgi:uncharacterized tellurite resistance protein B-like protein
MMVAEIITLCCLKGPDWQKETQKQQLQIWLEDNAESTLFILDGYDEIAETAATECELSDCLDAVLRQEQYQPYVMLTSRPIVIDSRYGSFDRRLECMGFIDENIPVFVQRYITDLQQSSNCLTFLKTHPNIWGTAHIPLNLELICWLWSKGELSVDNSCYTMTALYSQITTKMKELNVEERKHPSLSAKWQYANNPFSETTVADFAEEFLPFLGFHAMQQSGVLLKGRYIKQLLGIFIKTKDIYQQEGTAFEEKQRKLLQACVDFSFLKPTQQGGKHLFDYTYYFIHLSFQEFFAAKYYQQAFAHADVAVIQHFQTHKYISSYQLTWWMSAGLLYQHGNNSGLRAFFATLTTQLPLDLIGIHHINLLSHCLEECQADEKVNVIARLTQHLARFFKHFLKREWPANTWSKTLLHCPNLLRAQSIQNISLFLFEELKQIRFIPSNTAAFLAHLATQNTAYFQHFITCLKDLDNNVRKGLTLALSQHLNLQQEHIKTLIGYINNTTSDSLFHSKLAETLANRLDLQPEQIQTLIDYVNNATLDSLFRNEPAKTLASRPDLQPEQVQILIYYLNNTTLDSVDRYQLGTVLANRPDLPPEQRQTLIDYVNNTTLDSLFLRKLGIAFAKHLDFQQEQVQTLIDCVKDMTLTDFFRRKVAIALAKHLDLQQEHIQMLIDYVKEDTTLDNFGRREIATMLAQNLTQYSNFNVGQLQQLLAYCLKEKIIFEKYPSLIFPILTILLLKIHYRKTKKHNLLWLKYFFIKTLYLVCACRTTSVIYL